MATVTRPDTDLPNPGDVMDAAQVTDWTNNVLTFLESTNIDEANVDLTGSDGIVGKSTAQTLTGLKTFNNNSAAAGGVRTAGKFQHIPGSGTVADNDGVELQFQGYNDAGTPETITYGEIETVFTDVSDGSEDADMVFKTMVAGTATEVFRIGASGLGLTSSFTIGTNGNGHDVKFFGDTSGQYMLWDESADELVLAGDSKLSFHDAAGGENIIASGDGHLEINAGTTLDITATTIDLNGAVAMNGATTGGTNITISGELDAATLDISGNADIDGTTNLDAVDIDGAVQIDATVSVGVDDQGYDVKFFGDTASAYLLWDTSADKLLTAGGATIDIVKDKLLIGGTAVTTTAAELNVLDAVTAGTVAASKAVVVDSNKDAASFRNITLTGELDAATLDISGNADIDGTL